jgi:glycogen(starch) synthase
MHIALVSRWYPPHTGYGGVAAYNYYLAHALVKLGHRVTIVAARWSADVPAYQDDCGVQVYRLLSRYRYRLHRLPLIGRQMRALEQLRYSGQVAMALAKLEDRDWPDVVEFAEVNAEGFVYLRRRRRRPVVVRCHTPTFILRHYASAEEAPYDVSAIVAMEKYSIRHADALTAPSHDMAVTIARECGVAVDRIAEIPNALDVDLFAPGDAGAKADRSAQEVTILHVGRLARVKGVEVLARAIPIVVAQVPEARFVFAGEGSAQPRLTDFLRQQGVLDRVTFLGGVDQATLAAWYRKSAIAVVPSLNYESFSYTCAQAMAAGLPVVASRMGGMPETIEDCGLLAPPADHLALADALIRLAQDADLRRELGRLALQRARSYFDAAVVAEQMLAVYQRVGRLTSTRNKAPQ